jgi:DNA-binding transcriptional MerR regulator
MKDSLIGIDVVAKVFGKTINHMRNYKSLGIIEPTTKNGNKELYSQREVTMGKKIFDENVAKLKLSQIGDLVQEKLKEFRRKNSNNG